MRVAILGASNVPERFSNQAFHMLKLHGHEVVPVSPKLDELEGVPVVSQLAKIEGPVDTLTMYVGPAISSRLQEEILSLRPRRVIFNPGSENPTLKKLLHEAGIEVVEGCTLVMLRTKGF